MSVTMHGGHTSIYGEDTEIEPDRAEFILSSIAKWEQERLND
jgi:hypothetical protein